MHIIRILSDDTIRTQGVDWGKWNIRIELLDFKLPFIFVRMEGRTAYCDRMTGNTYSNPSFNIWKLKTYNATYRHWESDDLLENYFEYNRTNKKNI